MKPVDFLLPANSPVRDFRAKHRDLVDLGNLLLGLEWELVSLVIRADKSRWIIGTHTQNIHDYHREVLLSSMRAKPVIAMALMRMACELARDLFRMVDDPATIDL